MLLAIVDVALSVALLISLLFAIDLYDQEGTSAGAARDRAAARGWGYSHNNCLLCYQIYYKNGQLDPTVPSFTPDRVIEVPAERPEKAVRSGSAVASVGVLPPSQQQQDDGARSSTNNLIKEHDVNVADLEAIVAQGDGKASVEERRAVLQEVREHLDILKEFQDLVPEEELNKRKRELYLALPDAPPPAMKKRFSE